MHRKISRPIEEYRSSSFFPIFKNHGPWNPAMCKRRSQSSGMQYPTVLRKIVRHVLQPGLRVMNKTSSQEHFNQWKASQIRERVDRQWIPNCRRTAHNRMPSQQLPHTHDRHFNASLLILAKIKHLSIFAILSDNGKKY